MKKLLLPFMLLLVISCQQTNEIKISGEPQCWHKITLEIPGPESAEHLKKNPFLDYRLIAVFSNGDTSFSVPGYFAADGNAGESGATSGSIWKVHFAPHKTGTWNYKISFLEGKRLAISDDPSAGTPLAMDGETGSFEVIESDKSAPDLRASGRLIYTGEHYLRHAGTGEAFIKGGAGSPENFLAFVDFDDTYYGGSNEQRSGEDSPNAGLHAYKPHIDDWTEGDPTWKDGKGKGIIGAINYLASNGMNSIYLLTLNILGDGEDVWPYTDRNERYRFDCSKLDQWEVVLSHMESKGIMMHALLQETENEQMLDGGYLDVQRKLYLRELIARFGHHNAITWNLGEEHGPVEWMYYSQSAEDTRKMADYIRATDPYDQLIQIHTHPNQKNRKDYLPEYLNHPSIEGPSIQAGNPYLSHASTLYWIEESEKAGRPWVVSVDEIGPHWKGALPDAVDPAHDTIRKHVLWGTLMAGGAGVEWYFGYRYVHADLGCEDWRSRDLLWDQTRIALEFFRTHIPFDRMKSADELVSDNAYCFAREGEVYVAYNHGPGSLNVDLRNVLGSYTVSWYDPMEGGDLQQGELRKVEGGEVINPGRPPSKPDQDWVCLIRKSV